MWVIQMEKYIDQEETSNQIMLFNILQNLSHMYLSHHKIIKCVDFELIHCVINLNAILFSRVFSEFDFVFLSNILIV